MSFARTTAALLIGLRSVPVDVDVRRCFTALGSARVFGTVATAIDISRPLVCGAYPALTTFLRPMTRQTRVIGR